MEGVLLNMKIFGYQKDSEDLLKLEEVSIQCSIGELENIISFLDKVKREHGTVEGRTDMCHSHFRDWNPTRKKGEPDIIIVTQFKEQ